MRNNVVAVPLGLIIVLQGMIQDADDIDWLKLKISLTLLQRIVINSGTVIDHPLKKVCIVALLHFDHKGLSSPPPANQIQHRTL